MPLPNPLAASPSPTDFLAAAAGVGVKPGEPSAAVLPHDYLLATAGELLGITLGLYLLLVAAGRLLKRRFGARLGIVYQIFCVTMSVYAASAILGSNLLDRRDFGAASALLGALIFVRLNDQYFWRWYFEQRRKLPIPKFLREVTGIVILLVTVLSLLEFDYKLHVPGLLAGSGIIAVIIGLAMQDALGNIIAGFTLQFSHPFQPGDWLLLDNQQVKVLEINWRSSRFITNDEVQLDMPNQQIVKQTIINYHGGGSRHGMRLEVGVDYDTPPNKVKDILAHAAAAAHGVIADPAPNVFLKNFGDSAITYEVRFWLEDHRVYNLAADSVRTNIWYALHRHRIKIPFPIRTVHIERETKNVQAKHDKLKTATQNILRGQPLFQGVNENLIHALVEHSPMQHYGRGETIIRAGTDGSSMFVLVYGEAGVTVLTGGQQTRVATLRGGDCFGEMSLLTGEKRSASISASTDCEVLEVTKATFTEVIQHDAGLLPRLSELLARRQLETEGFLQARSQPASVIAAKEQEYQAGFLNKLKSFFEL